MPTTQDIIILHFDRQPTQSGLIISRRVTLEQLISNLFRISNWDRANVIAWNASKNLQYSCFLIITFTYLRKCPSQTSVLITLGISFSDNLSCNDINIYLVKEGFKRLVFFKRFQNFKPSQLLASYRRVIRPVWTMHLIYLVGFQSYTSPLEWWSRELFNSLTCHLHWLSSLYFRRTREDTALLNSSHIAHITRLFFVLVNFLIKIFINFPHFQAFWYFIFVFFVPLLPNTSFQFVFFSEIRFYQV